MTKKNKIYLIIQISKIDENKYDIKFLYENRSKKSLNELLQIFKDDDNKETF